MSDAEDDRELTLVEARFRALVHEWDLGRSQVAALLGVDAAELGLDLVPRVPSAPAERRLRMLVELRGLVPALLRDDRDVPVWLRAVPADMVDGTGAPLPSPLAFLCGPSANISAMVAALRTELSRRTA